MAVCGSCLNLSDRGKTISVAIESARNYAAKGSSNYAEQEYNFAIRTMQEKGGCSSCIRDAISEKDRNT